MLRREHAVKKIIASRKRLKPSVVSGMPQAEWALPCKGCVMTHAGSCKGWRCRLEIKHVRVDAFAYINIPLVVIVSRRHLRCGNAVNVMVSSVVVKQYGRQHLEVDNIYTILERA